MPRRDALIAIALLLACAACREPSAADAGDKAARAKLERGGFTAPPVRRDLLERATKAEAAAKARFPNNPRAGQIAGYQAFDAEFAKGSPDEAAQVAAEVFLAQHRREVYVLPQICGSMAVDVSSYARRYDELSQPLLPRARDLLRVDIEKAAASNAPDTIYATRVDMERYAASQHTSLRVVCLKLRANGPAYAELNHFSRIHPRAARLLGGDRTYVLVKDVSATGLRP